MDSKINVIPFDMPIAILAGGLATRLRPITRKIQKTFRYASVGGLCVFVSGCQSPDPGSIKSLGSGYRAIVYTYVATDNNHARRTELQFKNSQGKQITVWRSVGSGVVFKNVAVFQALLERSRLFAAVGTDLPLDITDEILWRWSKATGQKTSIALNTSQVILVLGQHNKLYLHFDFDTDEKWPDVVISLDWNQLTDIMREVKEKGVVHRVPYYGTTYIAKEYRTVN